MPVRKGQLPVIVSEHERAAPARRRIEALISAIGPGGAPRSAPADPDQQSIAAWIAVIRRPPRVVRTLQ
jgi:hypothetical protein